MMSCLVPLFAAVDPRRASEHYVRLATDPALANVSGKYSVSGRAKPEASSPLASDPAVQERIEEAAAAWAELSRQASCVRNSRRDRGNQGQPFDNERFDEQTAR
jgi:hypothetical protein